MLCLNQQARTHTQRETGEKMLPHHSLIAMRQQHDQPALPDPLGLTAGDKLVNDALGVVGEVAELCLPDDQGVGVGNGVTEFKTCPDEHAINANSLRRYKLDTVQTVLERITSPNKAATDTPSIPGDVHSNEYQLRITKSSQTTNIFTSHARSAIWRNDTEHKNSRDDFSIHITGRQNPTSVRASLQQKFTVGT